MFFCLFVLAALIVFLTFAVRYIWPELYHPTAYYDNMSICYIKLLKCITSKHMSWFKDGLNKFTLSEHVSRFYIVYNVFLASAYWCYSQVPILDIIHCSTKLKPSNILLFWLWVKFLICFVLLMSLNSEYENYNVHRVLDRPQVHDFHHKWPVLCQEYWLIVHQSFRIRR